MQQIICKITGHDYVASVPALVYGRYLQKWYCLRCSADVQPKLRSCLECQSLTHVERTYCCECSAELDVQTYNYNAEAILFCNGPCCNEV